MGEIQRVGKVQKNVRRQDGRSQHDQSEAPHRAGRQGVNQQKERPDDLRMVTGQRVADGKNRNKANQRQPLIPQDHPENEEEKKELKSANNAECNIPGP